MIGYFYRSRFRLSVRLSVRGNRVVFSVQAGLNRLKPVFVQFWSIIGRVLGCMFLVWSKKWSKYGPVCPKLVKIDTSRSTFWSWIEVSLGFYLQFDHTWKEDLIEGQRSQVMWGQMSCDEIDHVIRKQTYRCFILAIGGLRMIHIGFIVIKHIVWLVEYARLKIKDYFEVK